MNTAGEAVIEAKLELLCRCFKAIAVIYLPGALRWVCERCEDGAGNEDGASGSSIIDDKAKEGEEKEEEKEARARNYCERLQQLMEEVALQVTDATPPQEYRELLKELYFLWKKEIIPAYRQMQRERVREAFSGTLIDQAGNGNGSD